MDKQPKTDITKYVDASMYESEPPTADDVLPRVTLLSATPDPLGALSAACAMYEGRVIRDIEQDLDDEDRRRYWEQVQKTHLKAPLEFIDLHFMVENVSRAWTHQAVRQRTAVYAQESLRFAVKEGIDARPGPLVQEDQQALDVWNATIVEIWAAYHRLIQLGMPAEEARGLLPHDTLTRMNYKTNLRNLADHLGNRLCTQAQFEWRMVGSAIRNAILNYQSAPIFDGKARLETPNAWQFELIANSSIFQPVCFTLGHCPFTAEFDRGCTIRDRVQAGKFDQIDVSEWLADPRAAFQ